jgi:hypothetical protein
VPQKFLPTAFAIRCDQQLVTALGPAGHRALLPRLLASIDTQVQAVESYYESYCWVFGRQRRVKKEKQDKVADRRHADNHDLVSHSFLHFSEPFRTSSANLFIKLVLIIGLLQQHVVAVCCLADTTLKVARSKRCHVWAGVAGTADDEEPGWRDLPHKELD